MVKHTLADITPILVVLIAVVGVITLVALFTTSSLLLLLTVVGAGILPIIFIRRPTVFFYIIPILLSVEYRVELGFFSFTLAEISTVLVLTMALLLIWNNRRIYLKKTETVLLLFIVITSLPSVLLERDTRHALSIYRDLTVPLIFFVGFLIIDLSQQQIVKLLKLFVLVATVSAALGIMQYKTGNYMWTLRPEYIWWLSFKTDFLRNSTVGQFLGVKNTLATGLFAMPNNFASYLVIPTVLAFALATLPSKSRGEKLLWKASFILLLLALLFTFSRSSLFTFLASWLFLVWFRKKRRVSLPSLVMSGGVVLLVIGLVLWSGTLSWDQLGTFKGRGVMFQAGIELLRDHPEALLTGGFTEEYRANYYQPQLIHNLPLYAILQFGLLATSSWLFLVFLELRYILIVLHSKDQDVKFLGLALFGGIATTVFMYAQTTSFIDSVQSSLWLFFWLGIGVYMGRFTRNDALSQQSIAPVCNEIDGEDIISSA